MRRLLIAAAAALALVGSQAHAGAAPTWAERFERVRYRSHTWHHERFSIRENRLTVHAAAARLGAPEACMVAIVNRESGWNEHAQNPSSSAAGLFQFVEGTWEAVLPRYRAAVGLPDLAVKPGVPRVNARAASLVAAWLIGNGQSQHWGGC